MLRPPSYQSQYETFWSGDPAFEQAPAPPAADTATPATLLEHKRALAEYDKKLEVARETGDWAALRIEGQPMPTKFVMRPLPGQVVRKMVDRVNAGELGGSELNSLAFRAALVSIVNLGFEFKVEHKPDRDWGKIVTLATADMLDSIDLSIVTELGAFALQRTQGPAPKS